MMSEKKVWFITGAGRGMGVEIAKAALAAGDAVVATGRNTEAVANAVGEADDLLVVKLDVTSRADAEDRHPSRLARHAQAALGPPHLDLVDSGLYRLRVLLRLCRVEVWP